MVYIAAADLMIIGVIGALLIHGARTADKNLMKPWIVLTAMELISAVGNIFMAIVATSYGIAFACLLGWVIRAYLLEVVWSYKEELEDKADNGVAHHQSVKEEMVNCEKV